MKITRRGPCEKGENFVPMKTNEYGELQIHPCNYCGSPYIWSNDQQSFMTFDADDEALRARATSEVDKAMSEGAPGFRRSIFA